MEQKTILTDVQRRFLDIVLKEPYLLRNFYWTGGTVLSEFYLHHRESEDIDLFSEKREIHLPSVNKFVGIAGTLLGSTSIRHSRFLGLHSYTYGLGAAGKLKVDFNYYPFPRIETGKRWRGLSIDSLADIAVNKVHTISVKARTRDYVDIYCILRQEKNLGLRRLIALAKIKFDWHIEPLQLGENFAKVVTLKDYPTMVVPFDPKKMEEFFLNLAVSLKREILTA